MRWNGLPPFPETCRAALCAARDGAVGRLVVARESARLAAVIYHSRRPEERVDRHPCRQEPQGVPHVTAQNQAHAHQSGKYEDQPRYEVEGKNVEALLGRRQLGTSRLGAWNVEAGGDQGACPIPAAEGEEGEG